LAINDELGRLYVSDSASHQIKVFSLTGEFLFAFGERGGKPGQFNIPQGLAFDPHGKLFVADMLNARIQVFDADGEYLRHFGERGTFAQQMENPKSLSFDSEGHLYLIDSRRPNFRIFDPDGTLLLVLGGSERSLHLLEFTLPVGIYVDRSDRVIIADLLAGRVTVWQYLSAAYKERSKSK
jgi:sugar lactone lactonase YvrE